MEENEGGSSQQACPAWRASLDDMETASAPAGSPGWKRQIIAILLFGVAFGYVEAAMVTYLRPQFFAVRATFIPQSLRGEVFPMLSLQQVRAAGPDTVRLVATELAREAATLLMLGTLAAAVGANLRQGLAYFLLAFGAWDLSYYAFLRLLIGWPKSLLTWDILFLLPVPWSAPVLAPALVAVTIIATGLVYLWRESTDQAVRLRTVDWLCTYAGAALILASFLWDYRNVMSGGLPNPFHWSLFAAGEVLWLAALLHWARARDVLNPLP